MKDFKPFMHHIRSIVQKVGESNGFSVEETALLYRWKEIVGDRYAELFRPLTIESLRGESSKRCLYVQSLYGEHNVENFYHVRDLQERINFYFGFQVIAEIKQKMTFGAKKK